MKNLCLRVGSWKFGVGRWGLAALCLLPTALCPLSAAQPPITDLLSAGESPGRPWRTTNGTSAGTVGTVAAETAAATGSAELAEVVADPHYFNVTTDVDPDGDLPGADGYEPVAISNRGGDIAAALQWANNNAQTIGRPLTFTPGWYKISRPVTVTRSGVHWVAYGAALPVPPNNGRSPAGEQWLVDHPSHGRLAGLRTRFVWTGPPDTPMLTFRCAYFQLHGSLSLHGANTHTDAPEKCKTGILWANTPGLGSGKSEMGSWYLENFETAIQIGDRQSEPNVDNLLWDAIHVSKCGQAWWGRNNQGVTMDIRFMRVAPGVPRAFYYTGGGCLQVQNGLAFDSTWLTIDKDPDTGRNGTGLMNGHFTFRGLKTDYQGVEKFQLLDMRCPADITVDVDGDMNAVGPATVETYAELQGGAALLVRNVRSNFGVIRGKAASGKTPLVLLDACELIYGGTSAAAGNGPDGTSAAVDWQGKLNYRTRDCFNSAGEFLLNRDEQIGKAARE